MDKRKASVRARSGGDSAQSSGSGATRRSAGKSKSGGIGPLFFIMAGVVLAVIAGAFVLGGGDGKDKTPTAQGQPGDGYVSVKRTRTWAPQEPWTGEINRMRGTVRQGMSEAEVLAQFKPPHVAHVAFSEYDGLRTLEFPDDANQGGAFGTSAGVKLLVKIDIQTGKVVWFQAPIRSTPQ